VLYIDVPVNLFNDGFNLLQVTGYARLGVLDEDCIDELIGANWINILEQTVLRVGYRLTDDKRYLSLYPYPFVSFLDPSGSRLSVAVSDAADNMEMTAALMTVAGLGETVSERNDITFGLIGNIQSRDEGRLILFSLLQNLPKEYAELVGDEKIPPDGALLRRIGAYGTEMLLVVSDSGSALIEAARLLGDRDRVCQLLTTDHVAFAGESETLIKNAALTDSVVKGQYTLKDVLGHGLHLTGPFHQETTFMLPVPRDYVLSGESKFTLRFRYSENIDFKRSMVTVYWGDVPMTSKKLTLEGAKGDSLTFVPPADLIGVTGSSMRIAFELEIEDLFCTPRQELMPWAYLAEDSTFYLPMGKTGVLDLSNLPAPFQRGGQFNGVLAVMSDAPDDDEILLLGRAVSMLGIGVKGMYGSLQAIRASEFDENDADYNIVAVGTARQNAFIQKMNDRLYFNYDDGMDRIVSNEKLLVTQHFAESAGAVELIRSPFAEGRGVLVLTSPSGDGLRRLTELVSNDVTRWRLENDAVLIDERGQALSYRFFVPEAPVAEKPIFIETLEDNADSFLFLLAAMGVMMVLLLSVSLVLIRIRVRRKKDGVTN